MKRTTQFLHTILPCVLVAFLMVSCPAKAQEYPTVYVDKAGIMRRADTHAEVSYYGTNYTVPFAHAFRSLKQLGIDHHQAIDRDVYHMARLGLNAFRLHLWDVELSDAEGNLLDNEHLELLDYLIMRLEERGISIMLTAQTNFGNGYPEKNSDPNGAYSYRYDKCQVHDTETAIRAQERYIRSLATHRNRHTGLTYADDKAIVCMEINNEPCHSGTEKEVKHYINRMAKALRKGGWRKPILYNVSHNWGVTQAFYDADIDGTTYQWYPLNLVAGRTRHGNYLPYIDSYDIPFCQLRNFEKKAKIVYEFDPADNLYCYLYPAMARTFRKEGFQWMTQFAYDPMDMAWANTEYQTHFLNLAYTPRKALSMMVAAEVARTVERGKDFGKYPADTLFGDFLVSYNRDLAMLNDGIKYYHTNHTSVAPKSFETLEHVAGWGHSPVVAYGGSGAYFIDKLDEHTWRLEVMPDVELTCDPFAKPSLRRRVGEIVYRNQPIAITLLGLGSSFHYQSVTCARPSQGMADNGRFSVYPGVYLLCNGECRAWTANTYYDEGHKRIGEFVAPEQSLQTSVLIHTPRIRIEDGQDLSVRVRVFGPEEPDSVILYPADISFWNEHNRLYTMRPTGTYDYETVVDNVTNNKNHWFAYNIAVFSKGHCRTYPQGTEGTPLDWDYDETSGYYRTEVTRPDAPVVLVEAHEDMDGTEISPMSGMWKGIAYEYLHRSPVDANVFRLSVNTEAPQTIVMRKYVGDLMACCPIRPKQIKVALAEVCGCDTLEIGLVDRNGFTHSAKIAIDNGMATVSPKDLHLSETLLCPEPYPSFLKRTFSPDSICRQTFALEQTEIITLVCRGLTKAHIELKGIWME